MCFGSAEKPDKCVLVVQRKQIDVFVVSGCDIIAYSRRSLFHIHEL